MCSGRIVVRAWHDRETRKRTGAQAYLEVEGVIRETEEEVNKYKEVWEVWRVDERVKEVVIQEQQRAEMTKTETFKEEPESTQAVVDYGMECSHGFSVTFLLQKRWRTTLIF